MKPLDLLIKAPRAVTPDGERPASIGVADGQIVSIADLDAAASARETIVLDQDSVLMPGLVDSHVHICEPGNTEWEGFLTATRAAAAGGITTLVDMPLDSVPTTVTLDALDAKREAAEGQCHVDVGFWGGAIPSNLSDLPALHEAGVLGFKSFLCDTGADDFPGISPGAHAGGDARRRTSSAACSSCMRRAPLQRPDIPPVNTRHYAGYLASRPRGIENLAIAEVIEAARATRARAHILHLSSADALPMIASAIEDGVRLSVETCPHYLTLAAEGIADGATAAKVGPPVREERNREALWAGIADRTLDMIVSDHSPCTPAMKEPETGDFGAAWGGISSLQLGLPFDLDRGAPARLRAGRRRALDGGATGPARRPAPQGRIAVGCDADFAVLAPDSSFIVDPARLAPSPPDHALCRPDAERCRSGKPISAAGGSTSSADRPAN